MRIELTGGHRLADRARHRAWKPSGPGRGVRHRPHRGLHRCLGETRKQNENRETRKESITAWCGVVAALAHRGARGESAAALRGASGAVVGDAERGV